MGLLVKLSFESYGVHNWTMEVAEEALERILSEEGDVCTCPLCFSDMKALALNNLKPDYRPLLSPAESTKKRQAIKLENLEKVLFNQVMAEAYKAVLQVRAQPRHVGERQALRNDVEEILLLAVQEVLPRKDKRWQEYRHLSALMAAALNNLKPEYSTTYKGRVYARTAEIDASYLAQVYAAIYNALAELKKEDEQNYK